MSEPTAFGAHELFRLEGTKAIVTGAAHGLGLGVTTALASAGAHVLLFDRDRDALDTALAQLDGRSHVAVAGDAAASADVDRAVQAAHRSFDGVDLVVNGAAVYPTGRLEDVPDSDFLSVLDVNVAGYRRFIRSALPLLVESRNASVVNFASITLYLGIPPGLSSYITSKGAVVGLTRALARELGPEGVRVNAIAPGAFPTRAEEIIEDREAYDRQIIESQSLKRRGRVHDIAAAVLFLASPASSFISGQTLSVDGGWTFT